jgi:hypothetical protein
MGRHSRELVKVVTSGAPFLKQIDSSPDDSLYGTNRALEIPQVPPTRNLDLAGELPEQQLNRVSCDANEGKTVSVTIHWGVYCVCHPRFRVQTSDHGCVR